jgi:5-methylcytosine-specific restriction endonuclease McrA
VYGDEIHIIMLWQELLGDRKKRGRERLPFEYESCADEDIFISREKQKARELRQSPWWKKKLAGGVCHYCGGTFPPQDLTMDHKIPLVRGGLSEKNNLVPACKECNNRKKFMLPTEWEDYMQRIRKPSSHNDSTGD